MKTINTAFPETPEETTVRALRNQYGEQALGIALAYVGNHYGRSPVSEGYWRNVSRLLGGSFHTHLYSCGCHVPSGAEEGTEYDHLCVNCFKGDRT